MLKDILNNWIVRNVLGAVLLIFALVLVVNIVLSVITQHNREYSVPDFTNMTFQEASDLASRNSIAVEIGDSVFVRGVKRGVIYSQSPKAGSMVKKGRRVLVTTNAFNTKKVTLPLVVGCSMRQAKAEILSKGLVLGKLTYVSDMATNNVLRQFCNNRELEPGSEVDAGSVVDLVLGLDEEDNVTYMPNIFSYNYVRAVDAVQDNSLNIIRLVFDETVSTYADSLSAKVYRQGPEAGTQLTLGSGVSMFLTLDENKLKKSLD